MQIIQVMYTPMAILVAQGPFFNPKCEFIKLGSENSLKKVIFAKIT